jgi:hypothetical protein
VMNSDDDREHIESLTDRAFLSDCCSTNENEN